LTSGGNQITGCSILTGGKMIFIYYYPVYLLILNADGSTDRKIPLHISYGMDVACIDQNTAAVTSPVDKYITLVDLNTEETVKCIVNIAAHNFVTF
jgi:hypothetical protein